MSSIEENLEALHIAQMLPGIKNVEYLKHIGSDLVVSVRTYPKFNKQPFAQQLFVAASTYNPLIRRFAVQLTDNPDMPNTLTTGINWHVFDAISGKWSEPTAMPPDWAKGHIDMS